LKKNLARTLQFFIFLGIGVFLLFLAFKGVDIKNLFNQLFRANYLWILLSLLLGYVGFWSRACRWRLLIEPLGYKPSNRNVFYALMIGYLSNFALPRIGEVTRCGTLKKTDKIPFDSLIGTVIIERAIDIFILALLFLFLLVFKFDLFGAFLTNHILAPIIQGLHRSLFVLIAGCTCFISLLLFSYYFRKKLAKFSLFQQIKNFARGIISGLKTAYKMKNRRKFLLHTILMWSMYLLINYVIFFSIPATANLTLIDGLFLLVVSGLGMSAPVQGGIGVFHWLVSLALTLYGISRADGLVYATLAHGSEAFLAIFLGSVSLIFVYFIERKKYNNAHINSFKNEPLR
jgi:glycosyltransferase 2 family protein